MNRRNSCLLVRSSFLWLYCVLQFCVRFSFLGSFCVAMCLRVCAFVVLDLVTSVLCQKIGYKDLLHNDLFCVTWDIKPQLKPRPSLSRLPRSCESYDFP